MKRMKSWLVHPYAPLLVIILFNLIAGARVATDYGESWDEHLRIRYAVNSLAAYSGSTKGIEDEKGPFFVMIAKLGSDLLQKLQPSLRPIEAWHVMIFLSFQLALVFLYMLCLCFTRPWAATGAVLLFDTQPLLWGHSWINPKDIPFMAFFLGAVALGLRMVQHYEKRFAVPVDENLPPGFLSRLLATAREDWRSHSRSGRLLVGITSALSLALLVIFIFASGWIQAGIAALVSQAYHAGPTTPLGELFLRLAANRQDIPLDAYIRKSAALFTRLVGTYFFGVVVFNLIIAALLLPNTRRSFWRWLAAPFVRSVLIDRYVLAAGVFLGLSSSIRTLGPAAALLIGVYFLIKSGWRSLRVLAGYLLVAVLVTYITWPNLWRSPLRNYQESLGVAADFPWEGKVMFFGVDYTIDALPRSYLPVLLLIQFTETSMLAMLWGVLIAGLKAFKDREQRWEVALLAAWFAAPIAGVIIVHPTLYDNFRQFLFIVPPLFVFAALGLQWVFERLRGRLVPALILLVLLAPNIYWDVRLHPYQYTYYNSLVGGPGGAFRRFEMDYWATSYREAALYINRIAPQGALVIAWGADHLARTYARQDLVILDYRKADEAGPSHSTYAIISTRHDKDLSLYPDAPVLFRVGRAGAVYAVVKQIQTVDSP